MAHEAKKLTSDVIWNLAAFGVTAVVGLCLNFGIARFYGAASLGTFNWVFASYIVASQFAAWGINLSLVKHVGELEHPDRQLEVMRSGMRAVLMPAIIFGSLYYGFSFVVESIVPVNGVRKGIEVAAPAVALFAFNKAMLGGFNGLRAMRLYAVALVGRALGISVTFLAMLLASWSYEMLPLVFIGGEVVVLIIGLVGAVCLRKPFWTRGEGDGVKRHWNFGIRALPGGLLAELNTRVDVLILGLFVSEYALGIYSFAALLAEGLFQIAIVLRSNVNPIISRRWAEGKVKELEAFLRKGRNLGYLAGFVLCSVAVLLYPLVARIIGGSEEFVEGWLPFGILALGIALTSGYIPFSQIFLQTGRAFRNSILVGLGVAANVILNLCLIPTFGLLGAAGATALSWIFGVILLKVWVRKLNNLKF